MNVNQYLTHIQSSIKLLEPKPIEEAADLLFKAWEKSRVICTFGNGGSASIAEHLATDLLKWSRLDGQNGLKAIPLTQIGPATAIANDIAYREIFLQTLRTYQRGREDVAVAISCSGESPNIAAALAWAYGRMKTILITGSPNASSLAYADVGIICKGVDYRAQEDMFSIVCHILPELVRAKMHAKRFNDSP